MNCIAIDDEPLALNVIKDFCSKINLIHLKGTYTSAMDAIQILNNEQIDLIFIDIQMPHITGLEFVKSLKNPPFIILTTAYTEHALEGYELNVLDYLVKPIPFERFFQAVNKAYELFCLKNKPAQHISEKHETTTFAEYMLVRVDYSTVKVNFTDIIFIEGIKDYVKIKLRERQLLTKSTMKNMDEKLPSENFIRVHKSYIISLSAIEKIENNRIVFGDFRIPIGNNYKIEFLKVLDKFKL